MFRLWTAENWACPAHWGAGPADVGAASHCAVITRDDNRGSQRGFSLIELIVVLVILGLLAAVVAPRVYDKLAKGKEQIARIQIKEIDGALQLFSFDMGRFPNSSEGLEALIRNPGNIEAWRGPYLNKNELPKDPWGKPYVYRSPGIHGDYDLLSYGPDGVEGGGWRECRHRELEIVGSRQ